MQCIRTFTFVRYILEVGSAKLIYFPYLRDNQYLAGVDIVLEPPPVLDPTEPAQVIASSSQ